MGITANEHHSVLQHEQSEHINEWLYCEHVQNCENPFLDEVSFGQVPIC